MDLRVQHDHTDQAMKTLCTITKIFSILLCLLCLSSSFAADRAPDRDDDITTLMLQLERSKFSAEQQKDTASLTALFDDGLMWVDQNGILLTKAALLAALHDSHQTVDKIAPESMTVKIFATAAIVIGIYDETGLQDGHAFHRRCRFIDTWAWKKGKWVCIAATATSAIS
jgi:Domain of unknown function (DUF4440)